MLFSIAAPAPLAAALLLDALIGDPRWLWRRLPHPVALAGALIDAADRHWNRPPARARGLVLLAVLVPLAALPGAALAWLAATTSWGWIAEAVIAFTLIAQRDLHDRVAGVARALAHDGLAGARGAVAGIVGRDPRALDEAGVARAAMESLAENFSDGVVAPVFWYLVAGLPGLTVYKAVNTADSMIGHRSERHREFGRAAARCDDWLNLLPSRLAGLALAAAAATLPGASPGRAVAAMRRDAPGHDSPNAGWPEAALAGALGIALAGPRAYGDRASDGAWMGRGGRALCTPADMRRALALYVRACILWGLVAVAAASRPL